MKTHPPVFKEARLLSLAYGLVIFLLTLTGFAQMPIFKRYYIADIPGFAWLADFYFTHYLHYIGAVVFLSILTYAGIVYLMAGRRFYVITGSGVVRMAAIACIVLTGMFRVMKNMPDVYFSPGFIVVIDIGHLAAMMVFLMSLGVFKVLKSRWVKARNPVTGMA